MKGALRGGAPLRARASFACVACADSTGQVRPGRRVGLESAFVAWQGTSDAPVRAGQQHCATVIRTVATTGRNVLPRAMIDAPISRGRCGASCWCKRPGPRIAYAPAWRAWLSQPSDRPPVCVRCRDSDRPGSARHAPWSRVPMRAAGMAGADEFRRRILRSSGHQTRDSP